MDKLRGLDQLLAAETTRGGAGAGTVTYTYDENGNQVKEVQSKTQTTSVNTYDEENRLSKVIMESPTDDGSTKTFTQENLYNGEGQRIQKKEGASVTNYYYQDGVVSYTTDGNDTEKEIQNLLGLEGNIISAETVSQTEEDGTTYRYHLYNKDIQGSTTSIVDETGTGELSYEYDEFGETTIHGGSGLANEICYTGGIYDESTGLYYLNARYYDPTTGRFLTEDTYRGESGEVEDWHLYAYCANDPINYVDPSGHKYSAKKAADYGYTWGMKYNSSYPNYSENNKDCTNFVSQCVLAGGKQMKKPTRLDKEKDRKSTTKYWYCVRWDEWHGNYQSKQWKITTSWTTVKDFYGYWKKSSKIISCKNVDELQNRAKIGDIVQLYSGQRGWYHSIIISRGKKGDYKYAGHSNCHRAKTLNYLKQGESEKYRIIRIK